MLTNVDKCRTNPPDVKGTPRGLRLATGFRARGFRQFFDFLGVPPQRNNDLFLLIFLYWWLFIFSFEGLYCERLLQY